MTNKEFSIKDQIFLKACEFAFDKGFKKCKPTVRQASKFRMGRGTAFQFKSAASMVAEEVKE
jgi:hypothetical protein